MILSGYMYCIQTQFLKDQMITDHKQMSSTINTNEPWAFEFIWFIAVKSHDIHRESPLIPPSKYMLNACIQESTAVKKKRKKRTDLGVGPSCNTRSWPHKSKTSLKNNHSVFFKYNFVDITFFLWVYQMTFKPALRPRSAGSKSDQSVHLTSLGYMYILLVFPLVQ